MLTLDELRAERSRRASAPSLRLGIAPLLHATGWVCSSYLGVLVLSRLCADPDIPFDWRLLSPIIIPLTWLMVAVVIRRWSALGPALRGVVAGYGIVWLVGNVATSSREVTELLHHGTGYGAGAYQSTDLAQWLRGPGQQFDLYTNDPAAIWLVARQPARMLPKADETRLIPAFVSRLRGTHSAIVGLPHDFDPTLNPAELAAQLGFVELARFETGAVWAAREHR